MEVNLGIFCENWFYVNKIELFFFNFVVFNLSVIFYLKILFLGIFFVISGLVFWIKKEREY